MSRLAATFAVWLCFFVNMGKSICKPLGQYAKYQTSVIDSSLF